MPGGGLDLDQIPGGKIALDKRVHAGFPVASEGANATCAIDAGQVRPKRPDH